MEKIDKQSLNEAGICPNCWGRQAYEHKFQKYVEDNTRGELVKDPLHRKAFIQKFVDRYVSGIKLKNKQCPACKTRYNDL